MDLRNLQHNPVGFNFALFAPSAAVVWLAGTRLARCGKIIAERTGAGLALVGVVLLGGTVSLPELTTTVTATSMKSAPLAISTLLGGITFTMASLAVTDAAVGSEPLSMDVRKPVVLVQGALVALVLTVTALGLPVGDIAVCGVGAWTTARLALYSYSVVLIKRSQYKAPRHPELPRVRASDSVRREIPPDPRDGRRAEHKSTRAIALSTIGSRAAILVAGFMLTRTADALGSQTGVGASFAGLLLGGLATSLPEISSTISAARLGQ
ncbi:sodium:calcium antiporter [Sorangium sp. So ce426]